MSRWPTTKLGDHLEFLTSGSRGWSRYVRQSGDLFIRIQNVGRNELMLDDVAYVQAPSGAEADRTRVQAGDVLLSITADLGRTGVVPPGLGTAYINQHLALLRLSKEFHPPFVAGYVGVGPGRHQLLRLDRVGVKSGLNFDDVRSLRLPLPPLPEQKRIAAILDKADAIRRKRQEAIRLTEQLLRSAFLEMFGDPVTNPKGWEVKKLGECLDFITSGSRGWAKYYSDEGAKFLRIQNVGRNQLLVDDLAFVAAPDGAEANRTSVQEGDVVLSITADLGRTAVIPRGFGKGHINQHLCLIRLREGNPTFVSEYLASSGGQVQIKRADRVGVKSGLNFDDVRGLDVLFPPRGLQDRFATIHSNIRGHIQLALAGGSKLGDLSSSLAARAFSGRL